MFIDIRRGGVSVRRGAFIREMCAGNARARRESAQRFGRGGQIQRFALQKCARVSIKRREHTYRNEKY